MCNYLKYIYIYEVIYFSFTVCRKKIYIMDYVRGESDYVFFFIRPTDCKRGWSINHFAKKKLCFTPTRTHRRHVCKRQTHARCTLKLQHPSVDDIII